MHLRMLFLLGCAILASLILSPSFAHYGSSNNTELPTRNDFRVRNLDQVVPDYALFEGEMYAGSLPIGNNHNRDERNEERKGALMFWLFAPYQPLVEDSLTLALNGGPGCSSLLAFCMFETGPVTVPLHPAGWCCLEEDAPLTYNEFAWTNVTAMLYVEQPVGVGYSVGEPEPQNEEELSGDFFVFLQNFYTVFQEFQDKRLFLVGESYAGMYVPSIAHKIHTEMQKLITNTATDDSMSIIPINLAGLGLGNAWVDAKIQGPATIDYAYWHGMIDEHTRDNLHAEWRHCMEKGPSSREHAPFHSFNTPDDCAMMTGTLMAAGQGAWKERPSGPNTYDVTTWDPYAIIHDDSSVARFFNDPRVKTALHAPLNVHWAGCIPGAGRRRRKLSLLEHDQPESTLPYIAELLDAGIRIIAYNGDRDLSTCAQGTEQLLNHMNWSGHGDWQTTRRGLWVVNEEPAGYAKFLQGLDFVVVYNSGHLVPYNQPAAAFDLLTRFLRNESFLDYDLPSFDFGYRDNKASVTTDSQYADMSSSSTSWFVIATTLLLGLTLGWLASCLWFGKRRFRGYREIDSL